MGNSEKHSMGWIPDYPDFRDYTGEHEEINKLLAQSQLLKADTAVPALVDLREWCPAVEDQESLSSCTAHAGIGIVEYYEQRAFGKHVDASRLFLYKVTRNILHLTGDTGAFLRSIMGALVLFGVPPEDTGRTKWLTLTLSRPHSVMPSHRIIRQ